MLQEIQNVYRAQGVPITDKHGACFGGIAISAPEARMTLNEILGYTPKMRAAAEDLAEPY